MAVLEDRHVVPARAPRSARRSGLLGHARFEASASPGDLLRRAYFSLEPQTNPKPTQEARIP